MNKFCELREEQRGEPWDLYSFNGCVTIMASRMARKHVIELVWTVTDHQKHVCLKEAEWSVSGGRTQHGALILMLKLSNIQNMKSLGGL